MSSLQKIGLHHFGSQKNILISNKVKSLSRQHHHHKSSNMLKTIVFNETNTLQFIEKNASLETGDNTLDKKEMRKYCITKFRVIKDQEKPLVKRKNISLNLFKRDDTQKLKAISKTETMQSNEALPHIYDSRDDRFRASIGRQQQSSIRSITPKRRFQILRMNKNIKIKTQITQENQQQINNVSFEDTLKKQTNYFEQERELKNQEIRTEEALGKGLRKVSLTKKKILVKNPFERHKKQKQALLFQQKNTNIIELAEFNQSQIHNCDKSIRSTTHHDELSQIIAMI